MGLKDAGVVHIEEDANCISRMARSIQVVRKKGILVAGRPAPRERVTPVRVARRAKVAAPTVVSFKSLTACMAEALVKCQEFKRAKAKNGAGKKRVKFTEIEKLTRKMARKAAGVARRANKARAKAEDRAVKLAANPIKNPGKYRKDKGYWTKDSKTARKAAWDGDIDGRAGRKAERAQRKRLKEVQKAADGVAVHYNMYISF